MMTRDELLIEKISQGDRNAFEQIFKHFYPMLCAYTQRFVPLEEAENIVQDIFVWLWENRESIVIERSLAAYLFRIAYRKALNNIKHSNIVLKSNNIFITSMRDILENEDFYQIKELSNLIEKAINDLPETYREAFVLNRFKGLTYKEIAQRKNISHKTVDYRIQQALKILRTELRDYLPMLLTLYVTQL